MIKLRRDDGVPVWLQEDHIVAITFGNTTGNPAIVSLSSGDQYIVQEKPRRIMELIEAEEVRKQKRRVATDRIPTTESITVPPIES